MSAYRFQRAPAELADTPWRPLDRALLRWTLAHGGSPLVARLAAWTSFADGEGDTALPLAGALAGRHGAPVLASDERAAVRNDPLVSDGSSPAPFAVDAHDRFYLWRNHADEVAVAQQLRARREAGHGVAVDDATLDELFGGVRSDAVARQRQAVAQVGGRRLFVLTGGPGTGKTTTVLRMLLMLQHLDPDRVPAIQVGAPTGKAAQRLVQSLRQGKQSLQASLPDAWRPRLERIPDSEALTLHRMLAYDPRRNRFGRHAAHPLAADIVVVDEASMIDLALLRALLEAVRPDATLVLVGDADQLTSVAAGSVLMDVVAVMEAERAPEIVRLEHSFRAGQQLVPVNRAVRAGEPVALREAVAHAGEHAPWTTVDDATQLRRELIHWTEALAHLPIRPVLPAHQAELEETGAERSTLALQALHALARRQLLCALREDGFGALALNSWIEQRLKQAWGVPEDRVWYPGRAVLITRNDYATRLYNGDVGLCLADADGALRVWFETTTADGQPGARSFAPGTLPAHEGAFAITIHKSQGSEYDEVAVLLPPDPESRILSRQLLYTGLSRAKKTALLWASEAALDAALARPVRRAGGLADRLASTATIEEPQQLSLL
ncbi:exodeoxyribonuclease V subunit alpha [Frateuria sp. STR12]|uniref:exodeoxyribonuclease V subunit alpha n=1 Tax=Frateuria hangzhouensis TaxID=2995589 RepID=UPI002260AB76|nr:exodeoxyribonuclease V subunit alpha [Frateuria sp. STR12]MCX7512819.1 exodeoxyribonuclease V subunit alpha [Frateuria sp. STR12]